LVLLVLAAAAAREILLAVSLQIYTPEFAVLCPGVVIMQGMAAGALVVMVLVGVAMIAGRQVAERATSLPVLKWMSAINFTPRCVKQRENATN